MATLCMLGMAKSTTSSKDTVLKIPKSNRDIFHQLQGAFSSNSDNHITKRLRDKACLTVCEVILLGVASQLIMS
jgi:hypothetical protein